MPAPVRTEGLTERLGDILIQCSGSNPGAVLTGNLTVALPVSVTNRVGSTNLAIESLLAADLGTGFVPLPTAAQINNTTVVFNGLNLTVPPSGSFTLRISNIRAAVAQLGSTGGQSVQARLVLSGLPFLVNQSLMVVGVTQPSLFATLYNRGAIACAGSPVPGTVNMSSLFAAGTSFTSTRVTEGFATAFLPRMSGEDSGTRVLLQFSGFPAGAQVFVPDFVAGSDASTPTAGGDLGAPQSGGAYTPGSGALLLARVFGADQTGAGSTVSAPTGVGPIALNGASEVTVSTSGTAYAVYEVVDANPSARESAQFPVFVGVPAGTTPVIAQETLSLAPLSNVLTASTSAPVPRFLKTLPGDDCTIVGDCTAGYYPKLTVDTLPLRFTSMVGSPIHELPGYVRVVNEGGGLMPWTAAIQYTNGNGWAMLDRASGVNDASVRLGIETKGLTAGTYAANLFIDAGPKAGTATIPVTLTVSPAATPTGTVTSTATNTNNPASAGTAMPPPAAAGVTVTRIVNAATFDSTPLVPGSLGTIMGTNLAGKAVAATFDGVAAEVLYNSASQINLVVPAGLRGRNSASIVVTVDGASSGPQTVVLAPAWPAIFAHGILNENNVANGPEAAAGAGNILQIYATGIPEGATVSVQIGGRRELVPLYAGAAPTVPGVQQVNVAVPDGLGGSSAPLTICATVGAQPFCSASFTVAVQ